VSTLPYKIFVCLEHEEDLPCDSERYEGCKQPGWSAEQECHGSVVAKRSGEGREERVE